MSFKGPGRRSRRRPQGILSDIQETTMTTIDFEATLAAGELRPGIFARAREALGDTIATLKKRREERIILDELLRLDERMLRDLGIEPMDVYDAVYRKRGTSVLFNPVRKHPE
jgi:uncharacterized protein YjiS (DUF1127 family)